jgi:putative DNA primase/helicase
MTNITESTPWVKRQALDEAASTKSSNHRPHGEGPSHLEAPAASAPAPAPRRLARPLARAGEVERVLGERLAERDLDDLRASGLSDWTIYRNDLYTETNPRKVAALINWRPNFAGQDPPWHCQGGALVFPYRDWGGKTTSFARVRPHYPRTRNGDPVKYEQPAGASPRAYYPRDSLPLLRDGTSPLFLVEGEKKAKALGQLGLAAVGIGGVWCWKPGGKEELIPDLAVIPLAGRDVYIVFDWDPKEQTRQHTFGSARRLARVLKAAGAREVYWVELPPGPRGRKQGPDDFLVTLGDAGPDALRALVDEARPVPAVIGYRSLTSAEGQTVVNNAHRFATDYDAVARWAGPWDKWLLWDGRHWQLDQALAVEPKAALVAAGLFREIYALIEAAKAAGKKPKLPLAKLFAFAQKSSSAAGIRGMVALARPYLAIDPADLDADPWLFNVENGTIDLRTGELREHRKEDFITKLAPVRYDADATWPLWGAFLERVFAGNAELIGYVRRLVGYCLTGVTEEHVLPFLHGAGANGKTTLVETVLRLFGTDYAMKAAPDLLMAKKNDAHPTERADLFGKRFVACVETEEGRRLAEALVKELTGGDRVRARRMREDFWEFAPTHHLWLAGNHKPVVTGADHGIWRRLKLIPFDVVIPEAEQDKGLPAKLAGELPGILNWALAGCREWQARGLGEPGAVRAATSGYAVEMDLVGQFLEECCEVGPNFVAEATALLNAFRERFPDDPHTQRAFGDRLREKGFQNRDPATKKHYRAGSGRVLWRGLRLLGR